MDFLIFLFPFGGALAARLFFRRWQVWLAWGIASLASFLIAWFSNLFSAGQAITGIAIASGLGFLGPELWQGIRQFVVAVISRPRNWLYAGGLFLFIYSLWHPQLLGAIMTLAIMLFGFWVMFRGFRPRKPKKK